MPIFVQRAPVREHLRKYCATKNATVFRTIRFGLQCKPVTEKPASSR
jgi:hypothetical protein